MATEEIKRAIRDSGLLLSRDMHVPKKLSSGECSSTTCTSTDCSSGACNTEDCKSGCTSACDNSGCASCSMATQ